MCPSIEEQSFTKETLSSEEKKGTAKVLGVDCNCKSDNLEFSLERILNGSMETKMTKINLLSAIARLFDQLGLVSPIVLTWIKATIRNKLKIEQLPYQWKMKHSVHIYQLKGVLMRTVRHSSPHPQTVEHQNFICYQKYLMRAALADQYSQGANHQQ